MSPQPSPFGRAVGDFVRELAEFLDERKFDPIVAIAGFDIAKHQLLELIANETEGMKPPSKPKRNKE